MEEIRVSSYFIKYFLKYLGKNLGHSDLYILFPSHIFYFYLFKIEK